MAELLFYAKKPIGEKAFYVMRIWKVPVSEAFPDGLKYSFIIVDRNKPVLRYDNERGKGHHKHVDSKEIYVEFKSIYKLRGEFLKEVKKFKRDKK